MENPIYDKYVELEGVVTESMLDVQKFISGNNSAGTRVRKAMQLIKGLAQEIRVEVQDQKNKQF